MTHVFRSEFRDLMSSGPTKEERALFSASILTAIERSSRSELPKLASALWRAHAAGSLDDAEAQSLAEAIEARKALPIAPATPRRRVGSRPRSPESMERRRRWAASGRLPPALAAGFTLAEVAVLAVIALEVAKRGDCRLTIGHIAALAGVSASTVRNALREATAQGLLTVEERRLSWTRNAPNVVRIVSPEWRTWLRLGSGGPGYKTVRPTGTKIISPAFKPFEKAEKGMERVRRSSAAGENLPSDGGSSARNGGGGRQGGSPAGGSRFGGRR